MRLNINLTALVLLGVGVYGLYRLRPNLGPMSPEMRSYINQPVRPPIWDSWSFGDGWGNWQYSGDPAADLQRRFEMGHYGSL